MRSRSPALHYSITPLLHYSACRSPLHHSTPPLLRLAVFLGGDHGGHSVGYGRQLVPPPPPYWYWPCTAVFMPSCALMAVAFLASSKKFESAQALYALKYAIMLLTTTDCWLMPVQRPEFVTVVFKALVFSGASRYLATI